MPRKLSTIAPDWWDYTTLDSELIAEAARLTPAQLVRLSRDGFRVVLYDSLEDFYLAEALEYITAWRQATADNPVGICGPIGPTEQLPLVARLVNELGLSLRHAHFWGMDEWYENGREVPVTHPLSFERADRELCFNRIRRELAMPEANLHFPKADLAAYRRSWDGVRCAVMQGGQGDIKHWAFNDPVRRRGKHRDAPPTPAEYRRLATRVVELHPVTLAQNARTSGGGNITMVPTQAITVGPVETWQAEKVSIWQAGTHDNPLGQRLTTLMISRGIADSAVPMSLLAEHPNVQFNFFRGGLGTCAGIHPQPLCPPLRTNPPSSSSSAPSCSSSTSSGERGT
jgi:glucosamine-6-phosphate deaminase